MTTKNYTLKLEPEGFKPEKQEFFHFRGLKVRYLGPTNFKGARVVIEDTRHGNKRYIDYDYSQRGILEIALNFLEGEEIFLEIEGFTYNEKDGSYTLLTLDFKTKINKKRKVK